MTSKLTVSLLCLLMISGSRAYGGDRLAWTGAVTDTEGVAGGGIVPWALIGGLGTEDEFGATGFVTYVSTQNFTLHAEGASLEYGDRVEFSVARQRFDAGSVIPGLTLGQDIVGLKVRLAGDAVFAPDEFLPQLAMGAEWKHTLDFAEVPRAVGAGSGQSLDLYIAATKLFFAAIAGRNVVLDATLRRTESNQYGLLGFGGNGTGYRVMPEASAAVFLGETWLLGAEYRDKPSNLRAFRENSAHDAFLAWGPVKTVTLTAAWADLGSIAGKPTQTGAYLSLWVGF